MALNPLDQAIYALDRQIEVEVYIRGELLASGLSNVPDIPNLIGVDIDFDFEQMPPTATLTVADIAMHHVKIERSDTVEINAGFNGHLERIFTGRVKRRRHGVANDTIDCVGRTAVLTRPFYSPEEAFVKSWTSQTAVFAINDILDDLTPPFAPAEIDPILMDDGITNFSIGTVVPARMDSMPPSDMIRKIVDVYGHRAYEQKSGTLRIRDLLEVPAPTGYRIYGTQGTDLLSSAVLSHGYENVGHADSLQDLDAGMNDVTTTVSVPDASPFAVDDIIEIDSERMHVTAIDLGLDDLTVVRGVDVDPNVAGNIRAMDYLENTIGLLPGGYWRLGEAAGGFADSSANANTGAANGGMTRAVAGDILGDVDPAVTLNGTTGFISVVDHATLDLGDGPFTLEARIKKAADGTFMSIIAKGVGAYQLRMADDNTLQLLRENIGVILSSTITITGTGWHHVVATKNGATSVLYIDGVDVSGAITDSTMVNTGDSLHIGRRVAAADEYFNGTIDEAVVYPSVLTASQVLARYNISNIGTRGSGVAAAHSIGDHVFIQMRRPLGNVAASARHAQGFTPTADSTAVRITLWLRKIAAPTDKLWLRIEADDGSGAPNGTVLGGGDTFAGSILQVDSYTQVDVTVTTETRLVSGTMYHLVVGRTGGLDAVNYYEVSTGIGVDYAGGIANVYDSGGPAWGASGGDLMFEVEHSVFPTLRLLDIADDEDEDQIKKQAIVSGATVPSTTPASGDDPGGDETQVQITAERHTDRDDLVRGNYWLYAARYQNDLIETLTVADEVAARLVDKYHRILQSIEIEVPFDPRIDLGSTIEIRDEGTAPDYEGEVTGLGGNWWIRAYRHSLTPEGAVTYISLFGGDQSGTSSEANPQADLYWTMERELVGNAIQVIVTWHDVSTDADGWITNYHWVDDYAGGVNDVQGEGQEFRIVTFSYDPAVDASVNMTLTVTDNDGNTHSVTRAVDVTTDNEEVYAPVVVCAAGNTCMATFDGALSWADKATPSGVAKTCEVTYNNAVNDPPLIFFGTTTGRIYRSVDLMGTLPEVVGVSLTAGSEITGIRADKRIRERIWACCLDGRILRSNDFGATWMLYAHLGVTWPTRNQFRGLQTPMTSQFRVDPTPINGIEVSEPSRNRIWVYGGNGQDPESWFHTHDLGDDPRVWVSEVAEGDGAADPTGNAADTVVDIVVSHRTSGDLGLLFAGRDPVFIYAAPRYYDDIGGGSTWVDIGGTPADDGVGVAGNNNRLRLFGMVMDNKNFYRSQEGYGIWEVLSGVLPGTGANRPHDLLQISAWKDIYIAATDEGIAKSITYGETWDFLRPQGAPINTVWPGGAIGWDCAIEYRRPLSPANLMAIVRDGAGSTENALAIRQGTNTWTDQGPLPTGHSDFPHRLWHFPQIDDQTLFYIRYTSGVVDHTEDLYRSVNLGGAWVNVLTRCGTIARGPDGRLWASKELHGDPTGHMLDHRYPHAIYYNDSDGDPASWVLAHEDTRNNFGIYISYFNIAVDPNNHKRVMAAGNYPASKIRILVTEDAHLGAGATWSEVTPTGLTEYEGIAPRYHQPLLIAGENGRWIIGKQLAAANVLEIWVSDNNGAHWTLKYSIGMSGSTFGFSDAFRMGNILFFGGGMTGNSVDTRGRISFNNGDAWVELAAEGDQHQGFVYDSAINALIVNLDGGGDELKSMSPPRVGQSWVTGLEPGLDTAMGYAAATVENALAMQST